MQGHATKIALILKTENFRKSGMKHVEFLDNLSESEYVAREYWQKRASNLTLLSL
jgi:hypothetical protein